VWGRPPERPAELLNPSMAHGCDGHGHRGRRAYPAAVEACTNCGRDDDQLSPVQRVYLLPDVTVLEDVEWWCVSCRTQYPHGDAG
jgi:hypothetical protein